MKETTEDTYLHKGLRRKLVEEIKHKGIKDQAVLDAINNVPRHLFMDSGFVNFAYKDQAFPISAGQTISQPYTVAFQTELLQVKKHEKILEVGTGSGYQAAVLVELGAVVYTIERHKVLTLKAQTLLPRLGYNPRFFYGDGYKGLETYGPFDKVLITAAAPEIPQELLKQLRIGGRMVLPLGGRHSQVMTTIEKLGESEFKRTEYGNFVFVPLLKGKT
ncbi:MAG: protein-L-isoaspartate(D-aspartate) O-methyltransferase [Bacteroidales bacterium]|nr:protein-L-isoaspartate(D-aspartate) O-methyltransferase [Bacteroidales bacterium]